MSWKELEALIDIHLRWVVLQTASHFTRALVGKSLVESATVAYAAAPSTQTFGTLLISGRRDNSYPALFI